MTALTTADIWLLLKAFMVALPIVCAIALTEDWWRRRRQARELADYPGYLDETTEEWRR